VLMSPFVIAFAVVVGRQVVMLGGFLVVLRGLVVCFVCHWSVLWEISRRDPTRPSVNSSLAGAEDSSGLQEINQAKKMPPIGMGGIVSSRELSSGDDVGIHDQGLNGSLGQNLRHGHIGIPAGGNVHKYHICGILGAGRADVQFTNSLDGHGGEQKTVCYLNAGRINQFRAHGASHSSS
jgi:hypothetical protein